MVKIGDNIHWLFQNLSWENTISARGLGGRAGCVTAQLSLPLPGEKTCIVLTMIIIRTIDEDMNDIGHSRTLWAAASSCQVVDQWLGCPGLPSQSTSKGIFPQFWSFFGCPKLTRAQESATFLWEKWRQYCCLDENFWTHFHKPSLHPEMKNTLLCHCIVKVQGSSTLKTSPCMFKSGGLCWEPAGVKTDDECQFEFQC